MTCPSRSARINIKLLIVIAVVVAVAGAGVVVGHKVRKRMLTNRALVEGQAAYAQGNWPAAARNLKQYLTAHPDDPDRLDKYARANLAIRPLGSDNVAAAIGAYRRLLVFRGDDASIYRQLAILYNGVRNFGEAGYVARKRLENAPDDVQAPIWLAEALIAQGKQPEARQALLALVERIEKLPDKRPEFVQACSLLSDIAAFIDSTPARTEAMEWLNRAVAYNPQSPEAYVHRGRFQRSVLAGPDRQADVLASARADLDKADALQPADPRVRLVLATEWMLHGDYDRAGAELQAIQQLDDATLSKYYFDPGDWMVEKFQRSAELAMRTQQSEQGVTLAEEAVTTLKLAPHRYLVLPMAVELYVAGGKQEPARKYLDEYLTALTVNAAPVSPSPIRLAYLQAIVARLEGKPYKVIELLTPATAQESSDPALWKLLAEAYSRTDQSSMSVQCLLQVMRLRPRDAEMAYQLAREYARQQDYRRASETARLAETLNPKDIASAILRIEASIYLASGQSGDAGKAALEALAAELAGLRERLPDRMDVRLLQADVAVQQGQMEMAETMLKQAPQRPEEQLLVDVRLVRIYARQQQVDKALEVCRAACERYGQRGASWQSLAEVQWSASRHAEAIKTLREGLTHAIDLADKRELVLKQALFHILQDERPSAMTLLKEWLATDKEDVATREMLLSMPEVRQDEADAQKLVEGIRGIQGDASLLWRLHQANVWMSSHAWRARQKDILDQLNHCIDGDPGWASPVLLLAELNERLGNLPRAEEVCRRALSQNSAAGDVAGHLVGLLERQSRFAEAREVLDPLDNNSSLVGAYRIRLAVGAGDFGQAIDQLKLRIANDPDDADSRVLLARLVYLQNKDASAAFGYLDQAQAIAPESINVNATRVAMLKAEGRLDEARKVLDAQVGAGGTFRAYLLRASYLASLGQMEQAEQDYLRLKDFVGGDAGDGGGYELLGMFYRDWKRTDNAIASLEEGMKAHPSNLSIQRRLAKVLLMRGRPDDRARSGQLLADLDRRLPDDPDLLWVRSVLLLTEPGEAPLQQAAEMLSRVVQLQPTAVEAHLSLINLALRRGDYAIARDLAIRGGGTNPQSVDLVLARARAELALNELAMARELARLVLRTRPDNAEACEVLVDACLAWRDADALDEARRLVESAISRKPDSDRLRLALARALTGQGQAGSAIAQLVAYTQTPAGSRQVEALLGLADLYRQQGDLGKCEPLIQAASSLAPQSPSVLRQRIMWLGSQKRFDEIVMLMADYRALKAVDADLLVTAGGVLEASSSPVHRKEAMAVYDYLVSQAPQITAGQLALASLAYRSGEVDRAERTYRKVLESSPNNIQALNDLAWILCESRKNYPSALELADKGVSLAPLNRHLRDTRGVILSNTSGRLRDAMRDFEKAVDLSAPQSAVRARALLQLGRACARLGDYSQARRYLDEALQIDRQQGVFSRQEQAEIDLLGKPISRAP